MKIRSEKISLIMKLFAKMYNGTWTVNCLYPHNEKLRWCVFYAHGIHRIPCPDLGEKVLKILWYQRQEYNVEELSNAKENSLLRGSQKNFASWEEMGGALRRISGSTDSHFIIKCVHPISLLKCNTGGEREPL